MAGEKYFVVFLTPGQQAPECSTGVYLVSCDGIMCYCKQNKFPTSALLGHHLPTDPPFNTEYNFRLATQAEIVEYSTPYVDDPDSV